MSYVRPKRRRSVGFAGREAVIASSTTTQSRFTNLEPIAVTDERRAVVATVAPAAPATGVPSARPAVVEPAAVATAAAAAVQQALLAAFAVQQQAAQAAAAQAAAQAIAQAAALRSTTPAVKEVTTQMTVSRYEPAVPDVAVPEPLVAVAAVERVDATAPRTTAFEPTPIPSIVETCRQYEPPSVLISDEVSRPVKEDWTAPRYETEPVAPSVTSTASPMLTVPAIVPAPSTASSTVPSALPTASTVAPSSLPGWVVPVGIVVVAGILLLRR